MYNNFTFDVTLKANCLCCSYEGLLTETLFVMLLEESKTVHRLQVLFSWHNKIRAAVCFEIYLININFLNKFKELATEYSKRQAAEKDCTDCGLPDFLCVETYVIAPPKLLAISLKR